MVHSRRDSGLYGWLKYLWRYVLRYFKWGTIGTRHLINLDKDCSVRLLTHVSKLLISGSIKWITKSSWRRLRALNSIIAPTLHFIHIYQYFQVNPQKPWIGCLKCHIIRYLKSIYKTKYRRLLSLILPRKRKFLSIWKKFEDTNSKHLIKIKSFQKIISSSRKSQHKTVDNKQTSRLQTNSILFVRTIVVNIVY